MLPSVDSGAFDLFGWNKGTGDYCFAQQYRRNRYRNVVHSCDNRTKDLSKNSRISLKDRNEISTFPKRLQAIPKLGIKHSMFLLSYLGNLRPKRNSQGLLFLVVSLLICFGSAKSLEISKLEVPSYHVTGEAVTLECIVNLQGDTLYSVQWYKNSMEFFKYVPKEEKNAMRIFDVPGITVDTGLSTVTKVHLRTVTIESSGKYRCEVSADAPSFHTATKESEMLVVDLPDEPPRLTGGRSKYHVGDEVYVNCTTSRSHPPASLMWYINSEQAKMDQLIEHAPIYDEDGLATSQLGVKFIARLKHFPEGVLKLRCTATIAAVYWQTSETEVEGHPSQSGPALESKGVYTDCSLAKLPTNLIWHIILLIILLNSR